MFHVFDRVTLAIIKRHLIKLYCDFIVKNAGVFMSSAFTRCTLFVFTTKTIVGFDMKKCQTEYCWYVLTTFTAKNTVNGRSTAVLQRIDSSYTQTIVKLHHIYEELHWKIVH